MKRERRMWSAVFIRVTSIRLITVTTLLMIGFSTASMAKDNLEDILREGIRIIIGDQNARQNSGQQNESPISKHADDYYIDYRIKRRLNNNDRRGVAQATQRALDSGEAQRWRNRRAGLTVLVSVSDSKRYDNFDYTINDSHDRDRRNYSTYPDGQYERGNRRDNGFRDSTTDAKPSVPALLHVDDWYLVNERAPLRAGPGREFERIASLEDDAYVHVVGVVGASRDASFQQGKQRGIWVFIDDKGEGAGFVNARRLASYRRGQVDLVELAGASSKHDYNNPSSNQTTGYNSAQQCRSLTQRIVVDNFDQAYTSTWCLSDNNIWEAAQ